METKLSLRQAGAPPFLYTYVPKESTVDTDGLLSTSLSRGGWKKYKGRFGATRKEVLQGLDNSIPGFRRSKAISVLASPIPETADSEFRAFADRSSLYRVSAPELLAAGILRKAVFIPGGRKHVPVENLEEHEYASPDWRKAKAGQYLFSNVPHYFIELKDGRVPPEFVSH